jgi:hypothetical protein
MEQVVFRNVRFELTSVGTPSFQVLAEREG